MCECVLNTPLFKCLYLSFKIHIQEAPKWTMGRLNRLNKEYQISRRVIKNSIVGVFLQILWNFLNQVFLEDTCER